MNRKNNNLEHGVAMIEFAIVLPLLILILFGITELGRALYQQNTLYKAVSSGARYLARTQGTLNIEDNCVTSGNCCEKQGTWGDNVDTARNIITFGNAEGTGTPRVPQLDQSDAINIDAEMRLLDKTDETDVPVCVIMVDAEVPFVGLFGDIAVPSLYTDSVPTFNVMAETEERYIGY